MKAAFQRANLILRAFCSRDRNLLLKAYITYVRPLLEYNTVVWSPFLIGDIKDIEKVQRRFTRRLSAMENYTYDERLQILGLETLEKRRIRFDLVETFKIVKGISILEFADFFEFKNDLRTRGHTLQLRLRNVSRLDICKNFFSNRVVKIWNSLPVDAVNARSPELFKSKVTTEFLGNHCKVTYPS